MFLLTAYSRLTYGCEMPNLFGANCDLTDQEIEDVDEDEGLVYNAEIDVAQFSRTYQRRMGPGRGDDVNQGLVYVDRGANQHGKLYHDCMHLTLDTNHTIWQTSGVHDGFEYYGAL